MRLTIPRSASSFKGEALSFLSGFSARHYFGIWVSFIFQITCLHSPMKKRQIIMCLHSLMNKWQLTSFRSLKIHHVLAFLPFLTPYQSWSQICLSADAYMANREWSSHMPISSCNDRGVLKRETASLSIILLNTIVGWVSKSHFLP